MPAAQEGFYVIGVTPEFDSDRSSFGKNLEIMQSRASSSVSQSKPRKSQSLPDLARWIRPYEKQRLIQESTTIHRQQCCADVYQSRTLTCVFQILNLCSIQRQRYKYVVTVLDVKNGFPPIRNHIGYCDIQLSACN